MKKNKISVAIWMVTYNHEDYIAQAIESVMMQKTRFEYKLFIGEDCSTDKTRAICIDLRDKFPNKIKLYLQNENIGANKNAQLIFKECFESDAKYIALCEGDDFWIDSDKLQMQVDYLEKNPQYTLIHTKVFGIKNGVIVNSIPLKRWNSIKSELHLNDALYIPIAFTCSSLFLNKKIKDNIKNNFLKLNSGDWGIWVYTLLYGKAKYIDNPTAVYRMDVGISRDVIWSLNYNERAKFLLSLLNLDIKLLVKKQILIAIVYYKLYFYNIRIKGLIKLAKLIKPKLSFEK